MLINVLNAIILLLSYLAKSLLLFSTEDENGKENNEPDIDIGKVNMARVQKVVGVKRAPIGSDFIVGNEYDNDIFDGDVTFI